MPDLRKKPFWDRFKHKPKTCKHKHRKQLYDPQTKQKYVGQYLCTDCNQRVIIPRESRHVNQTTGSTSGFPEYVWKPRA